MNMNDRDGFLKETDINAQRRHRRRASERDEAAEAPYRRPVKPETEETGTNYRRPVNSDTEDEKVDFRKPIMPMTKETKAGKDAEEKPEDGFSNEDTQRIDLSETSTAAGTEPVGDTMLRADSRVPAEARRMTAAPYGTGKPEHRRPGTRPMVATPRPAATENSGRTDRLNGRALAKELRKQAAVGYAPGRMNEGYTKKIPARAEAAYEEYEYSGNRKARDYLERRGQPFRDDIPKEPTARQASRGLKLLVTALLIAGAVLTALLVLKNQNGGDPEKDAYQVISFDETKPDGATVCTDVTYAALTSKDVKDIRLVDEKGKEVPIKVASADNAEDKTWMITLDMRDDFEGILTLQVLGEDGKWKTTDRKSSKLAVKGVPAATPETVTEGQATSEVTLPPEAQEWVTSPPEETEMPESSEDNVKGDIEKGTEEQGTEEDTEEESGKEAETAEGEDDGQDEEFREIGVLRTPDATATPKPKEVEKPTETPPLVVEAAPEANPDLITNTTVYIGSRKQKDYHRPQKELIHMPEASQYTLGKMGVLTFRGDNFRRNAAVGTLDGKAAELKIKWDVESGSSRGVNQTYYGYGWPGQPAIVKWSKQVRTASNLYETKQEKEMLKEVIIAGQDGNIRFLDLEDGTITRNSIKLGYPMNGTPSLHTVGQPYMSVGQFARKMKVKTGRIGLRTYNLYNQKELKMIDGSDTKHRRPLNNVGSFETSALYDRKSDTMITAGSNGMLYLEALNSEFDWKVGSMKVSLSETTMTSRAKGQKNTSLTAVESSLAAYDKYVFYADMGGVLRCVDTDTLHPVWAVSTGDAVMAAVALDLTEDRELNLYTANMYANRKKGKGEIQIRRYDALSGKEAWCTDIGVYKGKKDKEDVGAKASPVIGEEKLKDLVFFTVTGLSEEGSEQLNLVGVKESALIALDKNTGRIEWAMGMESRTESSPVAVYDKEGNGWIIQCAQDGNIFMVDGLTGERTSLLKLEAEIIASPAVYNNTMVIGTTGKGTSFIYGIEIKTLKNEGEDEPEKGTEPEEAIKEMKEEEPADEADAEEAAEEVPEDEADADEEPYEEEGEGIDE